MIRCEGLGKRFDSGWALRHVDLEIAAGESVGLVGPGGSGKTVLLKLMAGLLTPDEGRVWVDGQDLASLTPGALAHLRERMGFLFQNDALFDHMTVAENVTYPLRQQTQGSEQDVYRLADELLGEVGLQHATRLTPGELSGGMRKRVGFVRATIAKPQIIYFDDPSAGLDPVTSSKIFRLIASYQTSEVAGRRAEGLGVSVIVSHEIAHLRLVCDRFVMLDKGRVRYVGAKDDAGPFDDRVAAFLQGHTWRGQA